MRTLVPLCLPFLLSSGLAQDGAPPNVILMMTDDQGWGDVGYNGHPVLKTPNLDAMAASGIRFDRFYAAAPVCSPTRGSCLTGRHPYRYGVLSANVGHMLDREVTLAEALRKRGFVSGHFGKWHLGTLTKKGTDSNRGGNRNLEHYSPPWHNGFDVCFSTEAKVPTWNPMTTPAKSAGGVGKKKAGRPYGTAYWTGPETAAKENLEGDDSRIIMDRAIPFIEAAVRAKKRFFAVIWFHAPHLPVVAGSSYLAWYKGVPPRERHYYGCISAIDDQVGRLRAKLRALKVARNTMLWFCSDNGPEGRKASAPGSAGPLRGRKRSLFEGGIRVPGILEWPAGIGKPRRVDTPCTTADYLPTVLAAVGAGSSRVLDGIDLLPLIRGEMKRRPRGIGFEAGRRLAWIDNRYKLVRQRPAGAFQLFDIVADPGEETDLAAELPDLRKKLQADLEAWRKSCKKSLAGGDYR